MPSNPEHLQAGSPAAQPDRSVQGGLARSPSPAHLAVERAIRDLKTAPRARGTVFVPEPSPEVTVASVMKNFANLRDAVGQLARYLRSEGVPPERMLPQVKTAVTDIVLKEGWKDRAVEQLVLENVVRWAIDAYYSE